MKIQLAAEKLARARRALMLPHCRGEAEDISDAFLYCSQGFDHLGSELLGDSIRSLIAVISEIMDTSGIDKNGKVGPLVIKAERLTKNQKLELSRAVDELAHTLERRYWKIEYGSAPQA